MVIHKASSPDQSSSVFPDESVPLRAHYPHYFRKLTGEAADRRGCVATLDHMTPVSQRHAWLH